jgi:hypothetical protein
MLLHAVKACFQVIDISLAASAFQLWPLNGMDMIKPSLFYDLTRNNRALTSSNFGTALMNRLLNIKMDNPKVSLGHL